MEEMVKTRRESAVVEANGIIVEQLESLHSCAIV